MKNEVLININQKDPSDGVLGQCIITDGWGQLPDLLKDYDSIYVVCDEAVESVVSGQFGFLSALRSYRNYYVITPSESMKTIESAVQISDWLLAQGANRNSLLLAVGGGITTDIAGFVAAIYMRGMRVAYVPTTLLAQVDASIGGKNGVNFHSFKNLLGTIRQPEFTYINVDVLASLPRREFMCGVAEMLKTFLIGSAESYRRAVSLFSEINAQQHLTDPSKEILLSLIREAVSIKTSIVAKDQFDMGLRHKLNLGHTFGHAIEHLAQVSDMDILHGEAVAMGIILSAQLSEKIGLSDGKYSASPEVHLSGCYHNEQTKGLAHRLKDDFKNCGLPVDCPFSIKQLVPAIGKDKKKHGKTVTMVFIRDIADVVLVPVAMESISMSL